MNIFCLSGFLLLLSCAAREPMPEYITLLDQTTAKFNKEICQEHQLLCRGYGGSLMNDISRVIRHYLSNKKCDVPAARRLVVSCVEKLERMINEDQKLHPFLHEYPFPSNRIEISIAFVSSNGDEYTDGSVSYIIASKGKLLYAQRNQKTARLETLLKEDYSEALRIVRSETMPQVTHE